MPKAAPKRSPCPISCTLDLIGDKWTLIVVRDLFAGKSLFKDFLGSPERIATNILANRLERLVEGGLVEKFPSPERAAASAYKLTAKGRSLFPVLQAVGKWGLENIEGTEMRIDVPAPTKR